MGLRQNIKKYRNLKGATLEEVATYLGLSRQTVQKYESGVVSNIPSDKIEMLAKYFCVDPSVLMGWEEEPKPFDPAAYGLMPPPKTYRVPRLGVIACGTPIATEENYNGEDEVPEGVKCDFTLKCQGDSMTGARINDGDIVYIRQTSTVDSGTIAAVSINGETTLKYIYRYGSMLVLRPANPAYSEIEISGNDLENVIIIGQAVGFLSRLR
ncbi:MAG: XRE family transcriptional regulator [Oscillospiraceae bacterium]|jgi:repressor LexA|nr:XRE family transcriptional regulator [Oscillospiraceae bacterium]